MRYLNLNAFTIIESLISFALLIGVLTGGMAFYFYSNQHTQTAFHRKIAMEIANAKMEEIKKCGYSGFPDPAPSGGLWQGPLPINIRDLAGSENIYVYDIDENTDSITDYKQVALEINWQDPGKIQGQRIRLDTYIGR